MSQDRRRRLTLFLLALASVVVLLASVGVDRFTGKAAPEASPDTDTSSTSTTAEKGSDPDKKKKDPGVFTTDYPGLADPAGFMKPYPNATVRGLLTFRGNPSRSYYGQGPVTRGPCGAEALPR